MFAQTTFFIALLTTLAFGVLSTNLIASGIAHQHQLATYRTLASDDGVDDFTALMRNYVRSHGTEGPWPRLPASPSKQLCSASADAMACPYTYTVTATITGASGNAGAASSAAASALANNDEATNLQKFLIDEERVSASVTTQIRDSGGVVASDTRYLTMRVFNGNPYVMISGQRSIEATNGSEGAIEGDNGGVDKTLQSSRSIGKPLAKNPDLYHGTEINVVANCKQVDDIVAADSTRPSHNQGRGNRSLEWGVGSGGGYELPCTDAFATAAPGRLMNESWDNGNGDVHQYR